MSAKKFHVRCDMEGVTGVVNLAQVTPGAPEYCEAQCVPESFVAEDTLRLTGASVTVIWADYWQRKLQIQRQLSSVS